MEALCCNSENCYPFFEAYPQNHTEQYQLASIEQHEGKYTDAGQLAVPPEAPISEICPISRQPSGIDAAIHHTSVKTLITLPSVIDQEAHCMKKKGEKEVSQLDNAITRMEQEFLKNFPAPDATSRAQSVPGLKRKCSFMDMGARRTRAKHSDENDPSAVETEKIHSSYFEEFATVEGGTDPNCSVRGQGGNDASCDHRVALERQDDSGISQTEHSAMKVRSEAVTCPSQ